MWKQPWGYAVGWTISMGLVLTGIILQFTVGKIDTTLISYPVNLIFGGVYLVALLMIYVISRRSPVLEWFSGLTASITSLVTLLLLVVVMGLTRQGAPAGEISSDLFLVRLGFTQMTGSWAFILIYFYFLSVLALVTMRKMACFRWRDTPFLLNHTGLFITLLAAVLGNGDMQRLRMNTTVDTPEWRATDGAGEVQELSLAIELKSFTIDEYPPKLLLIDNADGKALPIGRPENMLVESPTSSGQLMDWDIAITQLLPMSACVMGKDTTNFVAFHSEGATTAVYVRATNRKDGAVRSGWVSCGNYMFPYVSLRLDEGVSLVMPEREPKRFASEVTVYTEGGEQVEALVEVNKPLWIEGWKIYQLSYDEMMGRWSSTSMFELVRDPWLPVVYTGIILMLLGAVSLFITAPTNQKKEE